MDTQHPLFGLCASAPSQHAASTIDHVQREEALDPYRAITQRRERVLVPVAHARAARSAPEARLVEAPVPPNPRRSPLDRVRDRLRGRVPDRVLGALPQGWQRVGDVLVLRLPRVLDPHGEAVGEAYARVLDADSVLEMHEVQGPWREPRTRLLWGSKDTVTEHAEHGITYRLDPARVLFSPGNHHERHRLCGDIAPDEHVVDLCAGIGYFTLPLANAGARVTACEINPTSARFLRENARINDVEGRVHVLEGDANQTAPSGVADRVLVGFFPGTLRFLKTAVRALRPDGGLLHVHLERQTPNPMQEAWEDVRGHPTLQGAEATLQNARRVKTTGPHKEHVALDVEVIA